MGRKGLVTSKAFFILSLFFIVSVAYIEKVCFAFLGNFYHIQ